MSKLLYQGHGSYRITTERGQIIYVDPYAGSGYDLPADIVLVTHEHADHNQVQLVTLKSKGILIRAKDLMKNGKYLQREFDGIIIKAVPAYNQHHQVDECVGYLLELDGIKLYLAGDTSYTDYMQDVLSNLCLDYAILPGDGIYNMNIQEAARCADIIGAKHTIPVHLKPGSLYDEATASKFDAKSRLLVRPMETIEL